MSTEKQSNEKRYYDALRRITKDYDTSANLRKRAESEYGLDELEVLEMSYDNIQWEAARAIHGKRRPKS